MPITLREIQYVSSVKIRDDRGGIRFLKLRIIAIFPDLRVCQAIFPVSLKGDNALFITSMRVKDHREFSQIIGRLPVHFRLQRVPSENFQIIFQILHQCMHSRRLQVKM